ncbi:diguanylate cyclase [Nostoc sp. HG1]|nr:diguanylate cyclase [Nostoc sp. HG1]
MCGYCGCTARSLYGSTALGSKLNRIQESGVRSQEQRSKGVGAQHVVPLAVCLIVSLGVASIVPNSEISPQDLINAADKALYLAKQQGRDQVHAVGGVVTPS